MSTKSLKQRAPKDLNETSPARRSLLSRNRRWKRARDLLLLYVLASLSQFGVTVISPSLSSSSSSFLASEKPGFSTNDRERPRQTRLFVPQIARRVVPLLYTFVHELLYSFGRTKKKRLGVRSTRQTSSCVIGNRHFHRGFSRLPVSDHVEVLLIHLTWKMNLLRVNLLSIIQRFIVEGNFDRRTSTIEYCRSRRAEFRKNRRSPYLQCGESANNRAT